ncbi:MAG: DUF4292 domain-containing protein [Syntrophales bacterium]
MRVLRPVALIIAAVFIAAAGCTPRPLTPSTAVPPSVSAEKVLDSLSREDSFPVMRTRARFTFRNRDGTYSARLALALQRPANMRAESLPLIGVPDLYLTTNGDSVRIFLPREGRFYVGPSGREVLDRFLPIRISESAAVALLMGAPPPVREQAAVSSGKMDSGLYRIDRFELGRKRQSLWVDLATLSLVRVEEFGASGETEWEAVLQGHRTVAASRIPGQIHISFPEPETAAIEIRMGESEFSAREPGLFELEQPPGITPTPLE